MSQLSLSDSSNFDNDESKKQEKRKRTTKLIKKDQGSISIQKRKYQRKKKIITLSIDSNFLLLANTILLDSNLLVADGIFRFLPCLNQLSFNYQHQKVQMIEERHDLEVIDVQYCKSTFQFSKQKSQVAKLLNQMNSVAGYSPQDLYNIIEKYLYFVDEFVEETIYHIKSREHEIQSQFDLFIEICFEKVKEIKEQNESQFFFYQISSLDIESKEQNIIHMGYSKQYLDLLGLDKDAVSQIFLRNKKIDLFQNLQDISQQALKGLFGFVNAVEENKLPKSEYFESNIVTFDGYPIKIYQKKKSVCNLEFLRAGIEISHGKFLLTVVDLDIDLNTLQQLISYRQRISKKSNNSKIDCDFIKRENSFMFEDVEYSVESQLFIEKFYGQNLLNLQQIEQQQNEEKNKQCFYKFIKNQ